MVSATVVSAPNKVPSWLAPPESSLVAVEPGDFGFLAGLPSGPVFRNLLQGREAWSVALEFLFEELALTPQTAEEQRNRKQQGSVPPQSTDVPKLVVDRVVCNRSCSDSAAITVDAAQCGSLQQVCRREEEEVQAMHRQAGEDRQGVAELRRQAEKDRREAAELRREAEEDRQAARMVRGQAEELRRQAERVAVAAQASTDVGASAAFCDARQDQGALFSNAKELLKSMEAGEAKPHTPHTSFQAATLGQEAKITEANIVCSGDPLLKQGGALSNAKTLVAIEGAVINEAETAPMLQKAKSLVSGAVIQALPAVQTNAPVDLQPNLSDDPLLFGPEARAPFKPPRLGSASLSKNIGESRVALHVALAMSDAETSSSFEGKTHCLGPEARAPFKPPRPLENSMPVNVGSTADAIDFKGVAGSDDSLLGPTARKQFKRPRVSATIVSSDVGC
mmetsp:Transcript_120538/g.239952  ORF Transcript_120538/g.239952 Transcript_120538/m.239952 type:complete len:450 (-) Transcript_120538:158-1507(-)